MMAMMLMMLLLLMMMIHDDDDDDDDDSDDDNDDGAKRVAIASEEEGLHQYFVGDTHRTVAETPHNLNSSRSHCIFTIFIEASDPSTQTIRTSKVQIVDLAGSERLKPYEAGSQNSRAPASEVSSPTWAWA
eukprot:s807_g12.t1